MRTCTFCFERNAEITGEHILSDWINKIAPPSKRKKGRWTVHRRTAFDSVPVYAGRANKIEQKVRVVCKPCNNGWMSDMETKWAKPLLGPLIFWEPPPVTFSFEQQFAISTWAFMKAVVLDHMVSHRKHRFFSKRQCLRFFKTGLPPHSLEVWATQLVSPPSVGDLFGNVLVYHQPQLIRSLLGSEVLVASFFLNHFVIQVTAIRRLGQNSSASGPRLNLPPYEKWNPATVQLFPPSEARIWPAKMRIDPTTARLFAERWSRIRL